MQRVIDYRKENGYDIPGKADGRHAVQEVRQAVQGSEFGKSKKGKKSGKADYEGNSNMGFT